jgi:FMN phosphatase YigB (HAD superfamily)
LDPAEALPYNHRCRQAGMGRRSLPGAIKAVTFDWWGTLYVHRDARTRRLELLRDFLREREAKIAHGKLEEAYGSAVAHLDREWRAGNAYLPGQWLQRVLDELGVTAADEDTAALRQSLEDAMLVDPPGLVEGAAALVTDLHRADIGLGIISDTGLTVGRVMRRILARDGILSCFTAFAFSDETGYTKPHHVAFETALGRLGVVAGEAVHVGDLPETDVAGAKAMGMRAVLITGVSGRDDAGVADAVVRDFTDLRRLFVRWRMLT